MDAGRHEDDLLAPGDVAAALGLLTRLPVRVNVARAMARGGRAAWAWPVAGAVVAALAGVAGAAALGAGLSPLIAAALVLAAQAMLTGALHEDGLADCADGFWGGWSVERRIEIMRDSRTGTYGVLALVLSVLIRAGALAALMAAGGWFAALVALGAMSRVPMAALQAMLPNARPGGMSDRVGRPPGATVLAALTVALLAGVAGLGAGVVAVALAMAVVTLVWGAVARARIGGQTGDVLGASQQLAETAGLVTLAALAG
jgi:adenosylcobinamide-GDP ribazoletransferase